MTDTVADWMTEKPATTRPNEPALAALERMLNGGFRHLPVINDRSQVIGLLTLNDLRSVLEGPLSLRVQPAGEVLDAARNYSVGELMTHVPLTTSPRQSLKRAANLMASRRLGCLPVVESDGRLVGVLSETDAFCALAALSGHSPQGSPYPVEVVPERAAATERRLREEQQRILEQLRQLGDAGRKHSAEAHDQPADQVERGSILREVELDEQLARLAAQRLRALEHALDRAASGQLGTCEACSRVIPLARLRALPGTSLCIECARKLDSA